MSGGSGSGPSPAANLVSSFNCCQPRQTSLQKKLAEQQENDAPKRTSTGNCSWCFETCKHIEERDLDIWMCIACLGPSKKCSVVGCPGFARVEVTRQGSMPCASCAGEWGALTEKRRVYFQQSSNASGSQFEMNRESPQRREMESAGLIRPFLLLVSMPAPTRAVLTVQLGWSSVLDDAFGDSHTEAAAILCKKRYGLVHRCRSGLSKWNPLGKLPNWYDVLFFLAKTMFVPSYMTWEEEFQFERMDSTMSISDCSKPVGQRIPSFEIELLEKVSKLQRARMSRVQVCHIAALMASPALRKLSEILLAHGIDRQSLSLFMADSCFLARQSELKEERKHGGEGGDAVAPKDLASEVAALLGGSSVSSGSMYDVIATVKEEDDYPTKALLPTISSTDMLSTTSSRMHVLCGVVEKVGQRAGHGLGRSLCVVIAILLQKERLKLQGASLLSKSSV